MSPVKTLNENIEIDWQNQKSIWAAEPTNHRLVPGGSDYSHYLFIKKYVEPGARVLDVGCNCGQLIVNLAQDLDCDCVGVDIVPDFIKHCQETKSRYGKFICADFSRIELEELDSLRTFDAVTALELIEHPISVRGFRDNVLRILRPGGRLIITTPHPQSERYGYCYFRTHAHHVRMWTRWRLEQVFGPMLAYEEFERGPEFVSPGLATMGAVFKK